MLQLKLAFNNLIRNKRRSFSSLFIMVSGISALFLIGGFGLFTYTSLKEQSARDTGHLLISSVDYFKVNESESLEAGLSDYEQILTQLQDYPQIKYALPVLKFNGLISNGYSSPIFLGKGISPKELRARGPFINLAQGGSLSRNYDPEKPIEVLIGLRLAASLKLSVGDSVTLLGNTIDGSLNGFDAEVKGIVETGLRDYDERVVFTHYQNAQKLLDSQKISFISVHLNDIKDTGIMQQKLKNIFPNLEITNWEKLAFYYKGVKNLYDNIFIFIGLIILFIVFWTIFSIINMSVWERTKEIGTLRAIGVFKHEVIKTFLWEGVILVFVACLLSILFSFLVYLFLGMIDLHMAPPPGRTATYPLMIELNLQLFAALSLLSLGVGFIASFIAAKKAVNMEITEALTHV